MKLIKFKGYEGKGNADAAENAAMGLVVGGRYAVKGYQECCEGCGVLVPVVQGDNGIESMLIIGEFEECEG